MPKFAKEIIVPKSYAINNTNPRASLDVLVIPSRISGIRSAAAARPCSKMLA